MAFIVTMERPKGQILKRFTGDLVLREIFETQVLPNYKKLRLSMQRGLVDISFVMLLDEHTHPKFLRIR